MTPKIVLSVGRQFASGGGQLGKRIAEKLNMTFYDKEILSYAAQHSGIDEKLFADKDEKPVTGGFFQNINHIITGTDSSISDNNIFKFQSEAIRKAAVKSNCVIMGRCSDYILRNYKYCMSIFFWAPIEDRIQNVCKVKNFTDQEKARQLIEKEDYHRSRYYNYFTGKIWGASASYDASINVSLLGMDGTVDFTIQLLKNKFQNLISL